MRCQTVAHVSIPSGNLSANRLPVCPDSSTTGQPKVQPGDALPSPTAGTLRSPDNSTTIQDPRTAIGGNARSSIAGVTHIHPDVSSSDAVRTHAPLDAFRGAKLDGAGTQRSHTPKRCPDRPTSIGPVHRTCSYLPTSPSAPPTPPAPPTRSMRLIDHAPGRSTDGQPGACFT